MLKHIALGIVFGLCFSLQAQSYLGLKFGGGVGWWLQESNAPNVNGCAWDRSHLNFCVPLELSIEKKLGKRIRFGTYLLYTAVRDYEIVESTDVWVDPDRIPIAEQWFSMLGGGLQGQYNFFSTPKFDLYGAGQVGFFHLNTSHPDKLGFEKKYTFSLGPRLVIKKKQIEYVINPNYTGYQFTNTLQKNGRHKMYFVNFNLGVNFKIGDID